MSAHADIVIVNWNSRHYLAECLTSIREFGGDVVKRVTVVDNGSTDQSLEIDGHGLPLEIVRTGENLGFAKACNLGAARSQAEYILFLNPDARLTEGVLTRVLNFMESEDAAATGICGVRLLDEFGETHRHCARFPIWRTYLGKALGLDGRIPALFPGHFMVEFDHESNRAVDQVIGAFFFVRRALFDKLGGFDERFFVYFEEVDLSLRAKQAGWTTWYLADAAAFHKSGGSSEQVKATRLFYSVRSRMLYALKHFSIAEAAVVIAVSVLLEPISRVALAVLHRSMAEALNTIRGYGMIWKALPEVFHQHVDRQRRVGFHSY